MDWPWQYSFPPFFTIQVSIHVLILTYTSHNPWQWRSWPLQPHSATRAKQLEAWRHLVLNYCQVDNPTICNWWKVGTHCVLKVHTISVLDLADAGDLPLFHNASISRRLPAEAILTVLEDLAQQWAWILFLNSAQNPIILAGTWNGQTRANAEVTYSGSLRHS